MQLHSTSLLEKSGSAASVSDRARQLCARAKEQEEAGDFEAAQSSLGAYWTRVGERPHVDGLDEEARAEILLRTGTLSGWLGSARQISGAQEFAKDLISESASIFEQLGLTEQVAEARVDLAICYLRSGALDEARITLEQVLDYLGNQESEQKLRALLNRAVVEKRSTRYDDALKIHAKAAPIFEKTSNTSLKGKFHNEFATVLKIQGLAQRREDYIDRALVEYTAASIHFEQAGHKRFLAAVENNLGFLFVHLARFDAAHQHLDRARSLFAAFKDRGLIAQTDDTRARAFLGQGKYQEAEAAARSAVQMLAEGDEQSVLSGALTTHGTALARLGRSDEAVATLERAMSLAEQAGDPDSGGIAALTIIEELGSIVPTARLRPYYWNAEFLLARSQHSGLQFRLGECARRILHLEGPTEMGLGGALPSDHAKGKINVQLPIEVLPVYEESRVGSLEEEVLRYEGRLIKEALEASGGSVTRAAKRLRITHQGLAFILNGRQKNLSSSRKPVRPRRRSIIRSH